MTRMCLSVAESRTYPAGAMRKSRGRGKGTMSKELYWLTLTTAMTGLFWVPYILDRIMARGLMGATANALGIANGATAAACAVYFWARLVHYLVFTFGIPVLRTLSFAVGFAAQAVLVLALFKLI